MQDTMDRTIARRTFAKTTAEGTYLAATAELHAIGDQAPYFSLTGEEWERFPTARMRERETGLIGMGAMGARIVQAFPEFPELALINRLHLSTDNGIPMHAEANGWYWYSDYDGKGTHLYPHNEPMYSMTPHERAASYLRIESAELPEGLTREEFAGFVESLRERWATEAQAAREFLSR